ncbi:hypothetical protein L3Q67_01880 [Saccharothrix sp. AJ9571]|nr:hypothetical protein L3Q67_01880 [Saccharothrix sp. AJ9571]
MSDGIACIVALICCGATIQAWLWRKETDTATSTLQMSALFTLGAAAFLHTPTAVALIVRHLGASALSIPAATLIVALFLLAELILGTVQTIERPRRRTVRYLCFGIALASTIATTAVATKITSSIAATTALPGILCLIYVVANTAALTRAMAPQFSDTRLRPLMRWGIRCTAAGVLTLAPAVSAWHLVVFLHPDDIRHPNLAAASIAVALAICATTAGFVVSSWSAFVFELTATLLAWHYTPQLRQLSAFLSTGDPSQLHRHQRRLSTRRRATWIDLANAVLDARGHQFNLRRHARPGVYRELRERLARRQLPRPRAHAEAESAELLSALRNREKGRTPNPGLADTHHLDLEPPSLVAEARRLGAVRRVLLRRTRKPSRNRL